MIASLTGKVKTLAANSVILDVGGIGFEVFVPEPLRQRLVEAPPEEDIEFVIHTHLQNEGIQLYGFPSIEERDLFRVLISVPGIGPRLGLTLLSECPPAQLTTAIREENVKFLASFKGIGKKTAERIVLELKEKIPLFPGGESAPLSPERTGILADAVSGLVNFGFPAARAEKAVRAILARQETTDTVEVIRAAFKELSR